MLKKLSFMFVIIFIFHISLSAEELSVSTGISNVKGTEKIVHVFLQQSVQSSLFFYKIKKSILHKDKIIDINKFCKIDFNFLYGYPNSEIQKCIEDNFKNKNEKYIFYVVDSWSNGLIPFLKLIPKEKIKLINLYEESAGFLSKRNLNKLKLSAQDLKLCIDNVAIGSSPQYMYSFHTLYPTVYHIGLSDYLSFYHRDFIEYLKPAKLENMNIKYLASSLSESEKEELFKKYSFNINQYKQITNGKKVNIFVVGHNTEGYEREKIKHKELLINSIRDWHNRYKMDKNQLLYIKAGRRKKELKEFLDKNKILIPFFPFDMPLEILIIANQIPFRISGTNSTVYFNFPEDCLDKMYVNSDSTNFINYLLKLGKIKNEQVKQF